ncbi:MAG: hypothetical protein EP334_00545 [Gammaproteobacteria bacterium]|nr:MAG: hypothetical protein EP334_00545 [Gammaproteobacteria bacterium]
MFNRAVRGLGHARFVSATYKNNTSTSTSLVIDIPAEAGPGDMLVACMAISASVVVSMSPPSGWTEAHDANQRGVYYRVVDGTEGATATFTSSASGWYLGAIALFKSATFDEKGAHSSLPSVSGVTLDKKGVVVCYCSRTAGTSNSTYAISGWEEATPLIGATRGDNFTHWFQMFYKEFDSGATGTVSVTQTGSGNYGMLVAVS